MIFFMGRISPMRFLYIAIATIITLYLRALHIKILIFLLPIVLLFFLRDIKNISWDKASSWLGAITCGLIFSRVIYLYEFFDNYHWGIFQVHRGGMTVYGGLLLALSSCAAYIHKRKIPFWRTYDILIAVTFLALAFGRVGCFFNGCCFGKSCQHSSSFAVQFPTVSTVGHHQLKGLNFHYLRRTYTPEARSLLAFLHLFPQQIPTKVRKIVFPKVYATQLISAFYNLMIFLLLYIFLQSKRYDGQVFLYGICLYSICRFYVETLRADNPFVNYTGLTAAQTISFVLFCVTLGLILKFTAQKYILTRKGK